MKCMDCKYVRKAMSKDVTKVACGYISGVKHGIFPLPYKVDEDDFLPIKCRYDSFENFFNDIVFYNDNEIFEGWANLRAKPNSEIKGLITNYCVIVNKDNYCNYFEREA